MITFMSFFTLWILIKIGKNWSVFVKFVFIKLKSMTKYKIPIYFFKSLNMNEYG